MPGYSYSPKKTNHIAEILCIILSGASITLLYISSAKLLPFPWIFELISIMLLTVVVMILAGVTLKRYTYSLSESEGGQALFTVIEHKRGKDETVCSLRAELIEEIILIASEEKKRDKALRKSKLGEAREKFNYCVEFFPKSEIIIKARESEYDGESVAVILSPDKKLCEMLMDFAGKGDTQNGEI